MAFLLGNLHACVFMFQGQWPTAKAVPPRAETSVGFAHAPGSHLRGLQQPEIPSKIDTSTEMESLQVDIRGLPFSFLNSSQLVNGMLEKWIAGVGLRVVGELSHHFDPEGLTSMWLLSESHATIHTWPSAGYAAIDLLTCGNKDLLEAESVLEDMVKELAPEATFRFSFTVRGKKNVTLQDDESLMLAELQTEKTPVVRTTSKYQKIDVWDVLGSSWIDGEHVRTSRRLYLDGVLQLDTDDEYLYHEMLIHPAMLAHGHPEHVCILGGGDLAALHHVLRHSSVTSATLVEIDEMVISTSKAELGFKDAAFDPRSTIVIQDAFAWLANYSIHQSGSLDALFFDLLDVTLPSPLLDALFTGSLLEQFIRHAKTALRADGFAVFQLGEFGFDQHCSTLGGANTDCLSNRRQNLFLKWLKATFSHVQVYTQYVPSFRGIWTFAVATEHAALLGERWKRPAAELDADILARISQSDALQYVSGSTLSRVNFKPLTQASHVDAFQPRGPAEHRPWKAEACEHLVPSRPNSPFKGYQVPYRVAKSKHAYGNGIFTLTRIRRGETVWKFHNDSFVEVTPDNWLAVVEAQEFAKEKGVNAFLAKDWINEWPSVVDGRRVVKMLLELDDARFTNHGHAPARESHYSQIVDSPGASEGWADHRSGRAIVALRDIEPCEELLEDYMSPDDIHEGDKYKTPAWWDSVLESRGFRADGHDWPPSRSEFLPPYAWTNARANTD